MTVQNEGNRSVERKVIKWYEDVCTEKFGAVKFNYIMMMMKDYFVHYHAFPRYDKDINLFDMEWKDIDWPGSINFKGGVEFYSVSKDKPIVS